MLAAVIVGLGAAGPVDAITYYVRASGDDSRDGLSPDTARASVKSTARMLQNPGDQLVVGPGVFHEGNVKPRGSGTPEAPIVLLADPTGSLTHDAPGPVTLVPPNTPDATTGIIVYGRHDVIIDGFDVDGAADAGIQIRPNSRNGSDSSRITVRNNSTRNGLRKGIHVIAAGEVAVINNTVVRNGFAGIAVAGGATGEVTPDVSNNTINENRFGIGIQRARNGTVSYNLLQADGKGMSVKECDGLSIAHNQMTGLSNRSLRGSGTNLSFTDNTFDRGGLLYVAGSFVMVNNRFDNSRDNLNIYLNGGDAQASTLIGQNQLPRTYMSGHGRLEMRDNQGEVLQANADVVTAVDNSFSGSIKVWAKSTLEVSGNETAADLEARAPAIVVRDNHVGRWADVLAATGTVAGNQVGRLVIARYWDWSSAIDATNARGPYLIDGNGSQSTVRLGDDHAPLAGAVVQNNTAAERMRVFARGRLEVRHNDAHGIGCILFEPESELVLADNVAHQSRYAGLVIIGAARATVENNTSSENADSGIALRGTRNVTLVNNTFRANPQGGISLLVPLIGDCNGDLRVSVEELTTVVSIALGQRQLDACAAADADGDQAATVDEIMLAVAAAFDRPSANPPQVELRANRVEGNRRFGVNIYAGGPVTATNNYIVDNEGIALAINGDGQQMDTTVGGNTLGQSGAEGLLIKGMRAANVRNNIIFSSRESGVLLRDASATVVMNNLIYANGDDGISIGVGTERPANSVRVANNTIYANAGWGVVIGTGGAPSTDTTIRDNIVDNNVRGGIAALVDSTAGLALDFNLNNDANGPEVFAGDHDFAGDPRFVSPAGADGVLGGDGFADDDLHLQATQPVSAAINAGSAPAAALGITGSAIAGQSSDTGVVDVGFHYGAM